MRNLCDVPRLLLPPLICATLAFISSHVANASSDDRADTVRDSIIYLEVKFTGTGSSESSCRSSANGWKGSGFVITSSGYALTTAHNLKRPDGCPETAKMNVTGRVGYNRTGEEIPADVAAINTEADVALLKLADKRGGYQPISLCSIETPAREEYLALGFPEGREYSSIPFRFQNSDSSGSVWVVSGPAVYGMSGGPLIDAKARVVGIVKGSIGRSTETGRLVIPLRFATNLIASARGSLPQQCGEVPPESNRFASSVEQIKQIQTELREHKCYSGKIDGVFGPRSRAALSRFKSQTNSSTLKGKPTEAVLIAIKTTSKPACICPSGKKWRNNRCLSINNRSVKTKPAKSRRVKGRQTKSSNDYFSFHGRKLRKTCRIVPVEPVAGSVPFGACRAVRSSNRCGGRPAIIYGAKNASSRRTRKCL